MENLDELKQYEIAGQALQEMLDSHTELSETKKEKSETITSESLGKVAFRLLAESILKEMGPVAYGADRNPYEGCPKKIMKLQKLIRFTDRLLNDYKELYYKPYHQSEEEFEVSDELKEMMGSSIKIILGAAIGKMQSIWNEKEEEPRETPADPQNGVEIQIVPQDEVKSPAGDTYIVKEQTDDKVMLVKKSTNEQYNVSVDTFKKWKSN